MGPDTCDVVFDTLASLDVNPLSLARFNQLLTLSHEAPMFDAFFQYYWLTEPNEHPYSVRDIPYFSEDWVTLDHIISLDQLYWGLYRFYVDALLYFGNIRTAFQHLRSLSVDDISEFFRKRCFDTQGILHRGDAIGLQDIAKDNRYLISEMACKSFDAASIPEGELATVLIGLYREHVSQGGGPVTAKDLLSGAYNKGQFNDRQLQFDLSADEFLTDLVHTESDLLGKIGQVARTFEAARASALQNTRTYLSMVADLDVYVATSMRTRQDFRNMGNFCEEVFSNERLAGFKLRYFDPTLSAASHHEDKGLIECLMVKCAKVLILYAGAGDSYGKDSEAAMALSLGKPVIIYADQEFRQRFFRDIHPLSRLIRFDSGVAIGAMVATSHEEVVELLRGILSNELKYKLVQPRKSYLVLEELVTSSVVRLQTSDPLLRETFWNHYQTR